MAELWVCPEVVFFRWSLSGSQGGRVILPARGGRDSFKLSVPSALSMMGAGDQKGEWQQGCQGSHVNICTGVFGLGELRGAGA